MAAFSRDPLRQSRRVLIVDENEVHRAEFANVLRQAGYEVLEAFGAHSAMRIVLHDPPDVAVIDLMLPDGHGVDVARAFKAVMTTRDICVVAVTASVSPEAFVNPRHYGAAAILVKPVSPEHLVEAVDSCFATDTPFESFSPPVPGSYDVA